MLLMCGLLAIANSGCGEPDSETPQSLASDTPTGVAPSRDRAVDSSALASLYDEITAVPDPTDTVRSAESGDWTHTDWITFRDRVRWADAAALDTLPFRNAVAQMGRSFLGWTYTPSTLERPGEEGVVVNLRELDCVTFIENVLALTRFQRRWSAAAIDADPVWARSAYEGLLEEIRYRSGRIEGYVSRLHYFSEWLADHDARGLVALRTQELGGVVDEEPIDFMSTHPDAYRQLADPTALEAIRSIEARLSAVDRRWIPQDAIAAVTDRIAEGDLIAATSTVGGLDIAHTGIAVRVDGVLHLMHAPLVGRAVEISELPLADRILDIRGQDGIMVAEPLSGDR